MTDTTDKLFAMSENFFVKHLADQGDHDLVLMRAGDAREVIALVEIMHAWTYALHALLDSAGIVNTESNRVVEYVERRIERVLAAPEPRDKAVSDD